MIVEIKNIITKVLSRKKMDETIFIGKDLIASYLPSNPVIVDCGAHIGMDTIELAKIPGSTVYAFEPVKHIFEQLVTNTKEFKNIICFNLALNDSDGAAEMYVSSGGSDGSSSLLKPKDHITDHPDVLFNEVVNVKCQKLDTWAKENNISKVDMLWLDMQGAEQKMLAESESILEKVSVIHSEVSIRETYEGVESYNSYKKFLKKRGFAVKIEAIPTGYDMGNVLFVRK